MKKHIYAPIIVSLLIANGVYADSTPVSNYFSLQESPQYKSIYAQLNAYGIPLKASDANTMDKNFPSIISNISSIIDNIPETVITDNNIQLYGNDAKIYVIAKMLYSEYEVKNKKMKEVTVEDLYKSFVFDMHQHIFDNVYDYSELSEPFDEPTLEYSLSKFKENIDTFNDKGVKIHIEYLPQVSESDKDTNIVRSKLFSLINNLPFYLVVPENYDKGIFRRTSFQKEDEKDAFVSGYKNGDKNQRYDINLYSQQYIFYKQLFNIYTYTNNFPKSLNFNVDFYNTAKGVGVQILKIRTADQDKINSSPTNVYFYNGNVETEFKDNSIIFYDSDTTINNLKGQKINFYPTKRFSLNTNKDSSDIKIHLKLKNNYELMGYGFYNISESPLDIYVDTSKNLITLKQIDTVDNINEYHLNVNKNIVAVSGNVTLNALDGPIDFKKLSKNKSK